MPEKIRLDKVITLIGDTERNIFAQEKSVSRDEFYNAATAGLKPSVVFLVLTDEYAEEQYLISEITKHKIIRTYRRPDRYTELYCEVRIGG